MRKGYAEAMESILDLAGALLVRAGEGRIHRDGLRKVKSELHAVCREAAKALLGPRPDPAARAYLADALNAESAVCAALEYAVTPLTDIELADADDAAKLASSQEMD